MTPWYKIECEDCGQSMSINLIQIPNEEPKYCVDCDLKHWVESK